MNSNGDFDKDRATTTAYMLTQNRIEQVAHQIDGLADTPQITKYLLGVGDNNLSTEDLSSVNGQVRRIVYPDSETQINDYSVVFGYNRLGETRYTRDQNGTTHTFTRDIMGRITQDLATVNSNGPIDGSIDRIVMTYDGFGRPTLVETKQVSTQTVQNAASFTYTSLWQLHEFTQEPLGAISGSSKKVTYAYDTVAISGSGTVPNVSRPHSMTYPDGSTLTVQYDPLFAFGATPGSRISRPMGLVLGSTTLATAVEYRYIGLHNVAVVDYPVPDVLLDRSLAFDGSRTTGQYPGFDRFGRTARQTWADGDIAAGSGNGAGYPTKPPIVSLGYSYDKAGNITEKFDARPGVLRNQDYQYEYDGLHRLAEAKKGLGHGQNFTQATHSQQWNLGVIGNWNDFNTDLNGDGQYQSSNDRMVAGTFTNANEITQLVRTTQGSQTTLGFTHDKAGNLRENSISARFTLRYTHDAWNRLVKVETLDHGTTPATVTVRGEYQYNGLGQRVVKRSDHDITDATNALDEQRLLYYSAAWQVVEERIDDAWSSGHTTDRIVQHIWGLRYIDDLVLTRQDTTANGSYADKADLNHYALTDHQFSVVARVNQIGTLVDRIAYTPYGEARHQWYNDVNGDGEVNAADNTAASNASGKSIYQSGYNVDATSIAMAMWTAMMLR